MSGDSTLSLPFDQYQRYRLVADILDAVREGGEPLRVLDVGGRTALLRRFLPGDSVHLVDVEASAEDGLVLGDGSRLPFADGAVDAVVTFDTLEHVPPARRAAFVTECARVAARWVVIAGPYATPRVQEAEELLTAFLSRKLGVRHRYLAEHQSNGLPDLDATEAKLREEGGQVLRVGHANLDRWLALMCLELYLDRDPPLRAIAERYFRFYNEALYASDHAPPVYRHAVVAAFGGAPLPDPAALLAAPVAPASSFEPSGHLVRELLAFDVQRDAVAGEWKRLEQVNEGLHADLAGHEETLRTLRADLAGHRKTLDELRLETREQTEVIEALRQECAELRAHDEELTLELERERAEGREVILGLERDLAAHRELLEERLAELEAEGRELEKLRTTLGRERAAQEEVRATLEQDLDGHRALVRELEETGEALRGELERERHAWNEARQALENDLAGHRGAVRDLRAELEAREEDFRRQLLDAEQVLIAADGREQELRRELEAERAEVARQRAELADRWANLKRALRLRRDE